MSLRTDYVDSQYTTKLYSQINNSDGTKSYDDATTYTVEGDYFGAEDINAQGREYNKALNGFTNIASLITKINSVLPAASRISANSSPQTIINAINTIKNNSYNTGRDNGHSEVQNHPSKYGCVAGSAYESLQNIRANYHNKIDNAIDTLYTDPSYDNNPITVEIVVSDPITLAEAQYVQSECRNAMNANLTPVVSFANNARSNIQTAQNQLV